MHLSTAAAKDREGHPFPGALEGVVKSGSYDPTDGTVTVIQGDTFTAFSDDGDVPLAPSAVPIATTQVGDQDGPTGDEQVILIASQSGPVAIFHHGPADSPGAPAGERWITNRKRFLIKTIAGFSVDLSDDGKKIVLTTPGGFVLTLDDGAKKWTVTAPSGEVAVWDDGAKTFELGGSGLNATANAAMRQQDDYNALVAFKQAMVTAGVPNAAAIVVPQPSGSTTVRVK